MDRTGSVEAGGDGATDLDPALKAVLGTYHGESAIHGHVKMVIVAAKSYIQYKDADTGKWVCLWHMAGPGHFSVSDLAWHKIVNAEVVLDREELSSLKQYILAGDITVPVDWRNSGCKFGPTAERFASPFAARGAASLADEASEPEDIE